MILHHSKANHNLVIKFLITPGEKTSDEHQTALVAISKGKKLPHTWLPF